MRHDTNHQLRQHFAAICAGTRGKPRGYLDVFENGRIKFGTLQHSRAPGCGRTGPAWTTSNEMSVTNRELDIREGHRGPNLVSSMARIDPTSPFTVEYANVGNQIAAIAHDAIIVRCGN